MGKKGRRCSDCGKRRAIRDNPRCRPCHALALLDALDRAEIGWGEMDSFHRFQHEHYGLTEDTCTRCTGARAAEARLRARAA